ncbi:AbrB/MazE/SpoVT family DNA-binding domain-containing protein [Leptotrichia hofstadii]|uniref:SpoVT/AbrB-like protein n=1 Tax=Leptotrichia hofstadii F0254 TaxID=634994 RepID=C9N0Y1_9FUSO|nr:AbrB/MazE/SpoVT family DNA-binding domain-containing protein [Leptotrichia hofstadii]EEX73467.1 SpoVT/AbrB-like protein [Leptotrichia hofstadii F0254]
MAEVLKIQKWGNSQGIRLPKKILEMLDLKVNDTILIEEEDGCLKLKK